MTAITIPLSDDTWSQLKDRAHQTGLTPEEFLRRRVENLLASDQPFENAAAHVLQKNQELYRRLA